MSFKRAATGGVHFKGNTAVNGLPIGMEAASYWLSKVLFGHGLSSSALVVLNGVEKKEPAEGTAARAGYNVAIATGKTAADYFAENPLAEDEFMLGTQQYLLQASDHVEGVSLQKFIEEADAETRRYDELNKQKLCNRYC